MTHYLCRLALISALSLMLAACGPDNGRPAASATGAYWFCSDRSGNFEIYVQHDGLLEQVTDNRLYDSWWPRPSPDGRTLVFYRSLVSDRPASGGANNNYDDASLWSLNLASGNLVELIPKDDGTWLEQGVADWSPDSQHLVMAARASDTGGNWNLYLSKADGSHRQRLSQRDSLFLDPSFSPDGSAIAYTAWPTSYTPPGGASLSDLLSALEIHRADLSIDASDNATLSNEQRLTLDSVRDNDPYWAPDGAEIAFESDLDPGFSGAGRWALRAVTSDGGSQRTVLDDANINTLPRWSSDSEYLYFHRLVYAELPAKQFRLARVRRDGSSLTTLTVGGQYDDSDIQPLH